ncbi:cytochrome P450 [Streptosporangium sp. NPDC000396]|uniref:cytochrome P450 family protein n=1 Tax=Streptosporangium sp. NPDC000396 TaxID=3366185 RepID=UPI0036B7739F
MTTVADDAAGEALVAAPRGDEPGRRAGEHVLMVLNPGNRSRRLQEEVTGRGWQMRTADVPADDLTACVEAITDLLAAPQSPDRAVLLGYGMAGPAAVEVADRHPERAAAVVVVGAPENGGQAPGIPVAELTCPALVLAADNGETVASAVGSFLEELERQAGTEFTCPARLPALTPVLLNEPEVMRQLREMGPVHRINAPGVATSWILTGHRATTATLAEAGLAGEAEITAGFRLQSADPALAHRGEQDLITIDGREHARLRRLVGQYLTPRRVERLRPRLQYETDALLDTIPPGEPADLLQTFARPLPVIVLCELFGVPRQDRDYIYDWLVNRMTSRPPGAHGDIDDYLRALIASSRGRPGDDLLGWVVQAEGDRLREDDLVSAARLLMVGGHRAPTTLLANGVAALLRRPDQWKRLVDDPALIGTAVEELLRFVTPFPVGLARHAACPIDVGGVPIPRGDLMAASLVAANRDPSFFTDPDALDIGRAANPHLAFGHGHHYCLGAALARVQAQIAVGTLARRFPRMALAHDPGGLHYRQNRVRYLLELPVVLEPGRP